MKIGLNLNYRPNRIHQNTKLTYNTSSPILKTDTQKTNQISFTGIIGDFISKAIVKSEGKQHIITAREELSEKPFILAKSNRINDVAIISFESGKEVKEEAEQLYINELEPKKRPSILRRNPKWHY